MGKKKTSLKVSIETGQLVHKLAAHRNLSVENLFLEKDVTTFFKHLLIAEMKKEAERLKDQP